MSADRDEAVIRSYLLGRLPEPEAEALEDEYLARPEVWERVRGVEDDLLDDYAAGRLAPADKGAFETRYLVSQPLRERVMAARALRRALPEGRVAWRAPLAIAAGVLIALAAFWPRTPETRTVTSASPGASVAPTATPRPTAQPAGRTLVLALSPVLLRGKGRPHSIQIPAGTDTVVVEMEGDPAVLPPGSHALELTIEGVDGGAVSRHEARRAADRGRPSLLAAATVGAGALPAGDYIATLSAPGAGPTLYRYFFRVAR